MPLVARRPLGSARALGCACDLLPEVRQRIRKNALMIENARRESARRRLDVPFVLELGLFALLPVLLLLYVERKIFVGTSGFADLRVLLHAGDAVRHGTSPYPDPAGVVGGAYDYFVYPAPVALLMVPLAALPFSVAATIFSLAMIACVVLALWLLEVDDWRCYGAAFLWFPTLLAILVGNVTPLLILGVAALWRFRDRALIAGLAAAGVIVAKLFLWPLLVWMLATRRFATALITAASAVAITLAGWAVLGFDGLRSYPHLLAKLARVEEGQSFSLTALAQSLGLSRSAAQLVTIVAGAAVLLAAALLAKGHGGDRVSFTLALAAGLLLSPIVWLHFVALLLVPVALAERRLAAMWMLPIVLWVLKTSRDHTSFGSPWRIALPLAVAAVLVVASTSAELTTSLRGPASSRPTR
jgi:glycosyl transferase family 87